MSEAKIEYLKKNDDYDSFLPQEMSLVNLSRIHQENVLSTTQTVSMANEKEIVLSTDEAAAIANKIQASYGEALEICQPQSTLTTLHRHGELLHIFVKTLRGTSMTLLVKKSESIKNVKERIEKKELIPHQVQVLVYEFKQLEDTMKIGDYPNIMEGSTLILLAHLRDSMHCFNCFSQSRNLVQSANPAPQNVEQNANPAPQNKEQNVNPAPLKYANPTQNDEENSSPAQNDEQNMLNTADPNLNLAINKPFDFFGQMDQEMRERMEALENIAKTYETNYHRKGWIPPKKIKEATDDFSPNFVIGEGTQGKVYRGNLDGKDVAVKTIENPCTTVEGTEFFMLTELEICLRYKGHQNIVNFVGFSIVGACELLYLVTEFMPKGDLRKQLHGEEGRKQQKGKGKKVGPPPSLLSWPQRVHILAGIANALESFHDDHTKAVVYVDLQPSNVLVDMDYSAKLIDFGSSRFLPDDGRDYVLTPDCSVGYDCPIFEKNRKFMRQSDIYQLGVVIFEVISGHKAEDYIMYGGLGNWAEERLKRWKIKDLLDKRMGIDTNDKQFLRLVALARHCCARELETRPKAGKVLRVLAKIDRKLNPHEAGPSS